MTSTGMTMKAVQTMVNRSNQLMLLRHLGLINTKHRVSKCKIFIQI
jgi:hypothetical protein